MEYRILLNLPRAPYRNVRNGDTGAKKRLHLTVTDP